MYDRDIDFWVRSQVFFEYGVSDEVYMKYSSFYPFRPSMLETKSEKTSLIISVIRLVTNILMASVCVIINLCKIKKDWKRTFNVTELAGALAEFFILILFLVQIFSLIHATPTY